MIRLKKSDEEREKDVDQLSELNVLVKIATSVYEEENSLDQDVCWVIKCESYSAPLYSH